MEGTGSNGNGVWGGEKNREQWEPGVLGIRPPQILDPSQTPACAYQGVQGFKTGLEKHPGDELLGGGTPSTPGPGPLCRDAHWPPNPGTWVRVVGSSPTSPPGAHGREERSAGEAGIRLGGLEDPHPASGPSQVAEQFVFLAPVHLGCPLAGALLVRPLLGHGQRDVKVQEGAGC